MSNQSEVSYFDLHVEGVGYLNRVRKVQPKRGQEFLACSIAGMRGAQTAVEYTHFECRVSGEDAKRIITLLESDVEAKKQVIVGFRLGDPYPEVFTFEKGNRQGQQGLSIKARLLKVRFAKVNGQRIPLPHTPEHAEQQQAAA